MSHLLNSGRPFEADHVIDTVGPFDLIGRDIVLQAMNVGSDETRVHVLFRWQAILGLGSNRGSKERGASMVEYALLVILIAIVAFVAVRVAGQNVSNAFSTVAGGFTNPN